MLEWSAIPYCGPGAVPATFWTDWTLDPPLLAGLAAMVLGWLFARDGEDRAADGLLAAGWAVLVLAFVSPLCALSAALFSARIAHHLLLVAVAAPLLALALGRLPAFRAARQWPLVPIAIAHVVLFWLWHAPAFYAAAMARDGLYWLMELSLLVSAVLFWRAALDRRTAAVVALPVVIGVMAQMGLLAALLAFAGRPFYAPHLSTTLAWGLDPIEDQALAGLLMWVPGAVPYLLLVVARIGGLLGRSRAGDAAGRRPT